MMLRNTSLRLVKLKEILFPIAIKNNQFSKNSSKSESVGNEQQATYYTAKDIEFCPDRAKEVSQNYVEEAKQDLCEDDPFIKGKKIDHAEPCSEQEHAEVYQSFNPVSLHCVMQSSVPDPYTTRSKAPTHLNMPGGSSSQGYKYLSEKLQNTHHSKQ